MAVYTTIDDPSAHFTILLWTSNNSDDRALTNDANAGDFQPDFIWAKSRDASSDHFLHDTSRGITKRLESNDTTTEANNSSDVKSVQSNGFTAGNNAGINGGSATQVAWQWKANGGTRSTFTESGNNMGGGYQANATAGFSIVDYVGTGSAGYFSHGLGAAPEFMLFKNRSYAGNWRAWSHKMSGVTYRMNLNTNAAESSGWDSWTVGSSTVTLGTDGSVNRDGDNHIAYCFRSIQGYSKFGSYVGNGLADGPFVYTGFKPAYVMLKKTTSTGSHLIFDNKRPGYNGTGHRLYANDTDGEDTDTGDSVDLLSNGFKVRGGSSSSNADGATFVYMAFAEHPFVSSKGVPCTAR